MIKQRDTSIDALRGVAILGMVLSGSIAFNGVLPAWMYHAQVPPPLHQFNPTIFGITWVDLVFPFFLFAMGASIPLALKHKIHQNSSPLFFIKIACKRFLLLAYFALFTQHLKPWSISSTPNIPTYLLSLLAFLLLFFQLYTVSFSQSKILFYSKYFSYLIAIGLLFVLPFKSGLGFNFYKSDIILMVLANMALFGIIIYGFTADKPWHRVAILPIIMAFFLSSKETHFSWVKAIYSFSEIGSLKFDWLYQFYFLKYLFIVIPGMFAGEMLMKINQKENDEMHQKFKHSIIIILLIFLLILTNLIGLYTRYLFVNFIASVLISFAIIMLLSMEKAEQKNMYLIPIKVGIYLLFLGLFFESYEGGIRKDNSTYSYYFVTSGLAFLLTISLKLIIQLSSNNRIIHFFSMNGQNPMVAYVTGSLLLTPLLNITGLQGYFNLLNENAFAGFLKGVIFTVLVSLITIFFTKKKWFWRT